MSLRKSLPILSCTIRMYLKSSRESKQKRRHTKRRLQHRSKSKNAPRRKQRDWQHRQPRSTYTSLPRVTWTNSTTPPSSTMPTKSMFQICKKSPVSMMMSRHKHLKLATKISKTGMTRTKNSHLCLNRVQSLHLA